MWLPDSAAESGGSSPPARQRAPIPRVGLRGLTLAAVAVLTVLVIVPVVHVFWQAWQGTSGLLELPGGDPATAPRHRPDVYRGAAGRRSQPRFRGGRRLDGGAVPLPRPGLAADADRPAVFGVAGGGRPGLYSAIWPAGLRRRPGCSSMASALSSPRPASCW